MFRFSRGVALLACAGGVVALAVSHAPRAAGAAQNAVGVEQPPVLLITIDTLRADALGSYGGRASTPALDELAGSGVRFDNAVAHAVTTLPSHASILTGLDPSRHGVHDNSGFRVGDEMETLAERLAAAGYATGAFVGAFPLDSQFGLAQGFDVYDDHYGGGGDFRMVERGAAEVVSVARRWIRRQRGPWFAWVHVYDPHAPYVPPEPQSSEYADDLYAGEVAYTDSALKPLLADAARRGALVVVTSDHGESLGEYGEQTHGIFAYGATLRVPLLVAWPGHVEGGRVVPDRVRHIDITPTVLEVLGEPAADVQGVSLGPLLRGEPDAAPRRSYFESLTANLTRNWAPLRGLYDGDWKLIDLPIVELYAVDAAARETDNLATQEPQQVSRLRQLLADHLAVSAPHGEQITEDPATLRRLRALGYVGGGGGGRTAADTDGYGAEDDLKNLIELDGAVQQAVQAMENGDLRQALGLLNDAVAQRPDFVHARVLLAKIDHERGRTDAAIAALRAAAGEGFDSPLLLSRMGFYLRAVGRSEEAVGVLERALNQQPDDLDNLILLATAQGMAGRTSEAERSFAEAIERDPTYAPAYSDQGTFLLGIGQTARAQTAFQTAVQYDPGLAAAHNGLGVVAQRNDQLELAIDSWRTAVSLDPTQFRALRNLGIQLVRMDRFAEAIDVLDQLLATLPVPLREDFQYDQIKDMVGRIKRDR